MITYNTDFGGNTYEQFRFNLISGLEGFVATGYVDAVGHPTIGYGFDLTDPNIYNAVIAVAVPDLTPSQPLAFVNLI